MLSRSWLSDGVVQLGVARSSGVLRAPVPPGNGTGGKEKSDGAGTSPARVNDQDPADRGSDASDVRRLAVLTELRPRGVPIDDRSRGVDREAGGATCGAAGRRAGVVRMKRMPVSGRGFGRSTGVECAQPMMAGNAETVSTALQHNGV